MKKVALAAGALCIIGGGVIGTSILQSSVDLVSDSSPNVQLHWDSNEKIVV